MEDTVKDVAQLPGKALEKLVVGDGDPEDTPFRDVEDLKAQYFGPTLLNPQRLWELGDTALYQGAYALPGAAIGAYAGGPSGMFAGLAAGKLLGQLHLISKENNRLEAAKKNFSPAEKELLNRISSSSRNWALGSALLGGLLGGGASYLSGQDQFGKVLTPVLEGGAAASLASLAGGLAGHYIARNNALKEKRFKSIIQRYS